MTYMSLEQYNKLMEQRGKKGLEVKKKRSKYNAEKTWEDGVCWDSKMELAFYKELKIMQDKGLITGFGRQCQFILSEGTDKDNRAISYVADFVIFYPDGTYRIVDVKGFETGIFKQKSKLFKNKFPKLKLDIEK